MGNLMLKTLLRELNKWLGGGSPPDCIQVSSVSCPSAILMVGLIRLVEDIRRVAKKASASGLGREAGRSLLKTYIKLRLVRFETTDWVARKMKH